MSPDRAFRIPRAHKDRLHPRQLAAIAATCLSVGVALSGGLKASSHSHSHSHDERERERNEQAQAWQSADAMHTLPALQAVQDVIEAATMQSQPSEAGHTETSISAATVATPEPAQTRAAEAPSQQPKKSGKTAKPALVRGAVTYRCDSTDRSTPKPGACPRDRALEARVWRVLARLATCRAYPDAPNAHGHADLRLWFGPGTATRAVFGAPTISPSLNLRAVSQCVARDLSKLRATRKADRFELSLSFGLTRRN